MLACPNTCSFSSSFSTFLGRSLTYLSNLFNLCSLFFLCSTQPSPPLVRAEKWASSGRVKYTFQVFISYQICFLVVLLLVVVIIIIQTFLILSISEGAGIFLVLLNSSLHGSCILCSCAVLLSPQKRGLIHVSKGRLHSQGMDQSHEIKPRTIEFYSFQISDLSITQFSRALSAPCLQTLSLRPSYW